MSNREVEGLESELFNLVSSLSNSEKKKLLSKLKKKEGIPISVFGSNPLSGLEIIVKFLREIEKKIFQRNCSTYQP